MNELAPLIVKDGVGTVTLNRPESLNSMTKELIDSLVRSLENAASDESIRVVVLTGAGKAFCVGGDLSGMAEGNAGGLDIEGSYHTLVNAMRHGTLASQLLYEMPKPTIAAINGACAGAGLALACASDLRYCTESAVFNTAFARAGVSGDFGGTWTLPRIVGPAKARELYFLAEKFGANEAKEVGLVSKVFPDASFKSEISRVTERLTSLAPLALRSIKQNLNDSFASDFSASLDREAKRHIELGLTEDSTESARSFLEKRQPVFHGR